MISKKLKILYAIQGTGNGHVIRAREIIPIIRKYGDLDLLISGTQADIDLGFPVKFKFKGFSFIFGKNGGVDLKSTWKKMNLFRLYKDIQSLQVKDYDVIIHDFEPVAAWACKMRRKNSISLSHQCSLLFPEVPTIKNDIFGKLVLKYYAPSTEKFGFHFKSYNSNIFTPVIRREIRDALPTNLKHYTVYLPAYSDEYLTNILLGFPDIAWQVFTKHSTKKYTIDNIQFCPVDSTEFTASLISCEGLLTGAGFESPSEALHLGKKLLCIPMKNQYEQQCNARSLENIGVPIIWKSLKNDLEKLKNWLLSDQCVKVNYVDQTEAIISHIFKEYH